MLDKTRPFFNPIFEKIAKPFTWVNPNYITLIGFLSGFIYLYFMVNGEYWLALISFLGIFLDSMDGTIARMSGKITKFGGFFDATLDRLTDSVMMMAFGLTGLVNWPLVTTVIIASYMISYIRGKAEQMAENKVRLAVGIIERPERVAFLLFSTTILAIGVDGYRLKHFFVYQGLNIYEWIFIGLLILSVITIIQRFYAAWKVLR